MRRRAGSQWLERGKVTTADELGPQQFGQSVSLSANGDVARIGGAGAAWVFERAGTSWVQRGPRLRTSEDPYTSEGQFGWTVALSADGNTAVTGAHGVGEKFGGAAWVLRRSGAKCASNGCQGRSKSHPLSPVEKSPPPVDPAKRKPSGEDQSR